MAAFKSLGSPTRLAFLRLTGIAILSGVKHRRWPVIGGFGPAPGGLH